MKRKLFIAAGTIVLGAAVAAAVCLNRERIAKQLIFYENVLALSDDEYNVYGHCEEQANACIAICGNCFAKYIAVGEHSGGSYRMSGKCSVCKDDME